MGKTLQLVRVSDEWLYMHPRSERVGKTGVDGVLLTEAKYINLSLHFLEQVMSCDIT